MSPDLNLAEILYADGRVRYRYSRYLAEDGKRWIRHGLFRGYHEDGALASEGHFEHGREQGRWRDWHPNGQLAAEGDYVDGAEAAGWRYWDAQGREGA